MARPRSSIPFTSSRSSKTQPAVTSTSRPTTGPLVWSIWSLFHAIRSNIIIIVSRYIVRPVLRGIFSIIFPQVILDLLYSLRRIFSSERIALVIESWATAQWYSLSVIFNAGIQAFVTYYLATVIYPYLFNLCSNTRPFWPVKAPNHGAGQNFTLYLFTWFIFDIIHQCFSTLPMLGCWAINPLLTLNCWRHPQQNWVIESWHPPVSQPIIVKESQSWWTSLGGFALGGLTTLLSVAAYGRPWAGNTFQPGTTLPNPYLA